ncbi:MAG: replicative DNA helicase [Bacteroidales bacterium]|jgi:replicative DNA helicase|nr:replicative DNA helicase [Bacteroidales bacterium]
MAANDKRQTRQTRTQRVNLDAIAEDFGGRKPPQAIDIEEAVLGALLLEPEVVPDILDQLQADCFYKDVHKKIFEAITTLSSRNDPVDIFSVSDELSKRGELEEVGGMAYLSQLSTKIGAAAHVEYHTKVLLQKFLQRELISISYEVQKAAFDDSLPVDDLIDSAEEKVFTLAQRNVRNETKPILSVINRAVEQIEINQKREDGLSGVPSGYTGIDRVTFGWQPADLIILAARPSVGKTAFVLTMARNMVVDHHIPVAFFSLEMPDTQLVTRIMVSETGLPSEKLRGAKKMTEGEWTQLHDGLNKLSRAPLWIDDTPSLSIYEFRSKARRLVNKQHVKLIIIDYLQLMTGPPELKGMREQEVAAISRSLKAIAKELNVPIIALSQLNRSVETRGGNKRPQLSDLRESGAIEQDADIVMFIHRPEFLGVQDEGGFPGETDLIIAKHRNGEVRDVKMRFLSSEVKFVDYDDRPFDEPDKASYTESRMNMFQPGNEFDLINDGI